ncbi:MAG: DUF4258 domain-containing protein [Rectinemataceae bacterium]|nr:DUF4258 domain-containing protein [Rectinemataceae bacterium]
MTENNAPETPLRFILDCLTAGRVLWTYHMNMRMTARAITRRMVLEATDFEVIESYPDDKYMPSYLVFARYGDAALHLLLATDTANYNVRLVTAYLPNSTVWNDDMKTRRAK